ncbi:hypothetical protein BGZ63DRAFT_379472 [Mariannaea sp. PMI_226]|nr:hypothetical protein BGZ63DRAFT_379472 [Mariannaea sp. PMI_226]
MCAFPSGRAQLIEFRLHRPSSTEIALEGPRTILPHSRPPRKKRKRLPPSELASQLQSEEEWQSSRVKCGLDTPKNILDKLGSLKNLVLSRTGLEPWQRLVVIAATIVDLATGNVEEANRTLDSIYPQPPSEDTLRRNKSMVHRLIGLMDDLYSCLEHRAFEILVILNIPTYTLARWDEPKYRKLNELVYRSYKPKEEIQASAPIYIPFLVWLLRPNYSLEEICNALNTRLLGQREFERFQSAITSRKLEPCLLDTLGDYRTPRIAVKSGFAVPDTSNVLSNRFGDCGEQDRLDFSDSLDYSQIYPVTVYVSIVFYTTFDLPEKIWQNALSAGLEKNNRVGIVKPGSEFAQYDWSDIHTTVARQVLNYLVSKLCSIATVVTNFLALSRRFMPGGSVFGPSICGALVWRVVGLKGEAQFHYIRSRTRTGRAVNLHITEQLRAWWLKAQ